MSQTNHANINKPKDQPISNKIESRLTRLEVVIENINASLNRIENKMDKIEQRLWSNFYWMVGANAAILLVMAHGFKWI